MDTRRTRRTDSESSSDAIEIDHQFSNVASAADELLAFKPREFVGEGAIAKSTSKKNHAASSNLGKNKTSKTQLGEYNMQDPLIATIDRLSAVVEVLNSRVGSLNNKVDALGFQLKETSDALTSALSRVKHLEDINDKLQHNMKMLIRENLSQSDRIDALEQRERDSFIILNGSRATNGLSVIRSPHANNSNDDAHNNIKLDSKFVSEKIKDALNIDMPPETISQLNFLGKDKKRILIKLRDSDFKGRILSKIAKERPANFYVNEFLTRRRSTLFYKLRKMQKGTPKKFHSAFTFKGDIYYKLLENSTKTRISSEIDLTDLGKLLKIDVPQD